MLHDSKTEAFGFAPFEREAHAVVPHAKDNSAFGRLQADRDLPGFSVFDGVPDGLLRDSIKVNVRYGVRNER
jgi:hypothetical protein